MSDNQYPMTWPGCGAGFVRAEEPGDSASSPAMNTASSTDAELFELAAKFGRKDKLVFRDPGTSRDYKVECVIMEHSDVGQFVRSLAVPVGHGSAPDDLLTAVGLTAAERAESERIRTELLAMPIGEVSKLVQGSATSGEALARQFHDTYERLAPSFGYETRSDTRKFDPASSNGRLMIAVCGELRAALAASAEQSNSWPELRKATVELSLPELAAEFQAVAALGCDYTISAGVCAKLYEAMTTPPAAEQSNTPVPRVGGNTCDLTNYKTPATYSNGTTPVAERAAAPASVPEGDADELSFNAQRLRNVAALVGLASGVPKDDATLDGARGAVLGLIAAKLRNAAAPEVAQPAAQGEPPTLPPGLLNLIGDYGLARTDGINELDRVELWQRLIIGIKDYAKVWGKSLATPAPTAGEASGQKGGA